MAEPIIVCIHTDPFYFYTVGRLRDMVARHLKQPCMMVCLTDQPEQCDGVVFIDIKEMALPGQWAKMLLFEPDWRGQHKIIYFDLDTVIINDITPLMAVPGEFAICENRLRIPSRYSSSVMVIGGGMAGFVWASFNKRREALMQEHQSHEACIEALVPDAAILQRLLPKGFFIDHLTPTPFPTATAVIAR